MTITIDFSGIDPANYYILGQGGAKYDPHDPQNPVVPFNSSDAEVAILPVDYSTTPFQDEDLIEIHYGPFPFAVPDEDWFTHGGSISPKLYENGAYGFFGVFPPLPGC